MEKFIPPVTLIEPKEMVHRNKVLLLPCLLKTQPRPYQTQLAMEIRSARENASIFRRFSYQKLTFLI